MGFTYIEGTLTGPNGKQTQVKFLVDSGASYSLVPYDVWQTLELQPKRKASFTLADGTTIYRQISECHIALAGQEGHTPVVLGEPDDDQALLGAITLENLGLVLDPFKRTLHAMQLRLA
jgi:clan AA aspartic protease